MADDLTSSVITSEELSANRSAQPRFRARQERIGDGKALRVALPRETHARWQPSADRPDPIAVLEQSNQGRLPALIPIRYGRMIRSPFTFLRGSAALMASDLATMPHTGIKVQACGDCHLLNFGLFATPERHLVFDINDFDETHPAPWEWDLKRLVASLVLAGRDCRLSEENCRKAAVECVRSYREQLRHYSCMNPLEVWYSRLDMKELIEMSPDEKTRKYREELSEKAQRHVTENMFPKIVSIVGGKPRFVDQPPILYHLNDPESDQIVREGLSEYRLSLSDERRTLLDRYELVDHALKVVGIGSVATRCYLLLMFSEENHPLILQVKEARRSVLEPYTQPSIYDNQGQRVVMGQRLMQSSSDIFLGWVRGRRGFDFFVRQLRDMKVSVLLEDVSPSMLKRYGGFCGWSLARAHAKSGDSATISGYLGKGDSFDEAMGEFALAYADQTEHDHAALLHAVKEGRIEALVEEDL